MPEFRRGRQELIDRSLRATLSWRGSVSLRNRRAVDWVLAWLGPRTRCWIGSRSRKRSSALLSSPCSVSEEAIPYRALSVWVMGAEHALFRSVDIAVQLFRLRVPALTRYRFGDAELGGENVGMFRPADGTTAEVSR